MIRYWYQVCCGSWKDKREALIVVLFAFEFLFIPQCMAGSGHSGLITFRVSFSVYYVPDTKAETAQQWLYNCA